MKIGIIGAPGAGKTTLAYGTFYLLKTKGENVEIIPELAKLKVYQGEDFDRLGFNILNYFDQQNLQNIFLKEQFDYLISEAPSFVPYFYSIINNSQEEMPILKKVFEREIKNWDLILFVKFPENFTYSKLGRLQSKEEALKIEKIIEGIMTDIPYMTVNQETDLNYIYYKLLKKE